MNELHKEIKNTRDILSKHVTQLQQPPKTPQTHGFKDPSDTLDITKQVRNYYFRVEIENVFFQKLILEILRRHYDLALTEEELAWFNKPCEVYRHNIASDV